VSYHVDSTSGTYSAPHERAFSVRSVLLVVAFAGVGVLPFVLARAFGVSFAVSAPVLCVGAGEGDTYRHGGVQVVGFEALLPWIRAQSNPPVEFERLAHFSAGL
jgi:hypothetical protein